MIMQPFNSQIYDSAGIRKLEDAWFAAHPNQSLMLRAAQAATDYVMSLNRAHQTHFTILIGPGNNGADALCVAALLRKTAKQITLVMVGQHTPSAPDAQAAMSELSDAVCIRSVDGLSELVPSDTCFIDGLFGIGLSRPPANEYAQLIRWVNEHRRANRRSGCVTLSLDTPSGLDCDNGFAHSPCIEADHTITFIAMKPGLLTGDAAALTGRITLADLSVIDDLASMPETLQDSVGDSNARINQPNTWRFSAPTRSATAHKGTMGTLGVVGGSSGMAGAVILAARAGLRLGAGKVFVGALDGRMPAYDTQTPELMLRDWRGLANDENLTALIVGCGLGLTGDSVAALAHCLDKKGIIAERRTVLLDADALTLIATSDLLAKAVSELKQPVILTPHPGEAARLAGVSTATIQRDRLHHAKLLAKRFNAIVVLKGAGTVVASPLLDEPTVINTTGNAALAQGGTGDVLAGIIGALAARGMRALHAAQLGVYLHGQAADDYVAAGFTNGRAEGMIASDIAPLAATALARLAHNFNASETSNPHARASYET
jgi:ADP-dependent NAD(P)H-hydrate dehydratase / NAD(P)H-hydrate epimerase